MIVGAEMRHIILVVYFKYPMSGVAVGRRSLLSQIVSHFHRYMMW